MQLAEPDTTQYFNLFLGQKPREQAVGGSEDGNRTSVVSAGAVAETERGEDSKEKERQGRRLEAVGPESASGQPLHNILLAWVSASPSACCVCVTGVGTRHVLQRTP